MTAPGRLLDLPTAAAYLGLSPRALRALPIPKVQHHTRTGKASRRVFYDRRDLDTWIDQHKEWPLDGGRNP